jgi:hypothetical protein
MTALALWIPSIVAMQTASEFSRTVHRHAVASTHSPQDVVIVVLGAVAVVVTIAYTLLYLVRPGETAADHIKRRILDDDCVEPR